MVDQDCVTRAFEHVQLQLPEVVTEIQAVATATTRIVGLNHYDPYVAQERGDPQERSFALQTVGVIGQLNDLLGQIYKRHGVEVANVAGAFSDVASGRSSLDPEAAQMCALTWMCASPPFGPNPHPNDDGYRVIASAVASVIAHDR
jgi:hypothetical protein